MTYMSVNVALNFLKYKLFDFNALVLVIPYSDLKSSVLDIVIIIISHFCQKLQVAEGMSTRFFTSR